VTRAVEAYKAAIHGQPDLLPAYSSLGVALARAGRNDEAAPVLLEYETRLNDVLRRFHDAKVSLGDRLAIVDLLATVSDERVTKVLIDALKDPDARMRMAAGNVLGDDDSAEALLALAQATPVESDAVAKRVLFEALRRARDRAHASEPKPQMPGPKKR
jgi:HEAT repeat protein